METTGQKLIDNFAKLQAVWPNCEIGSVTANDTYYTDGMAADALFKIQFFQEGLYTTTVYFKENGNFYLTMSSVLVKKIVTDWIEEVMRQTR